ncbi:DUF4032 domain-containing protein [Chloroflexia bacterium SDU3-3]|nr:DUF4032 domain-containing protein [Chloroflexia bacterium SDU3-3]
MDNTYISRVAQEDFKDARRKAFFSELLDTLRRRPNELLSFDDVRMRLNIRAQRYLGHQTVPLANIVGSEGRYSDFDRQFLPRTDAIRNRWSNIDRAMIQSVALPPIELYKIGDVYFVRDGNHRVSVARQQGALFIDAFVTEMVVDVPLEADLSVRDLMLKEEYSDFLEWTDLAELRPDQRIEFSEPGGYLQLVRHINAHRYYMGLERDEEVPRDEAVGDWYDSVYLPIVQVIREQGVLRAFPGRTEADLYLWIMDHRWFTRERIGYDPGPTDATTDYVAQFGRRSLGAAVGDAFRSALSRLRLVPLS